MEMEILSLYGFRARISTANIKQENRILYTVQTDEIEKPYTWETPYNMSAGSINAIIDYEVAKNYARYFRAFMKQLEVEVI